MGLRVLTDGGRLYSESFWKEVSHFLTQIGAGPGADPAHAVPRFVIPAIFWTVLAAVALRQYRQEHERRDQLMGVAAIVGLFREVFQLVVEYGSHRGYFSFEAAVVFYPPLEHALELGAQVVAGYAFLSAFRGRSGWLRAFLRGGLTLTAVLYMATAASWAAFVVGGRSVVGPGPRLEFAQHWGDLAFRLFGVLVLGRVVTGLATARGHGVAPRIAALAFTGFLLDHLLMIVNIVYSGRYAWILSPLRHNLHMWAVPILLGVYWYELAQAFRRGEEQLSLVLEGSSDGFWDWDASSAHLVVGQRGEALLGYASEELSVKADRWRELVHPDDLVGLDEVRGRALDSPETTAQIEVRVRDSQGQWRWIEVRGKVVSRDADGRVRRAAGTLRDVTTARRAAEDRKALEAQLQQAQKFESLGLLASGVAHDFNNLLTIVRGNLDLAIRALPAGKPLDNVTEARNGATRAVELTAQLLAYAGKGQVKVAPVPLSQLAAEMALLVRSSLPRGTHLRLDCPEDLPPVLGDATQLRQLLMNLLLNAAQAMEGHSGALTVRTSVLDCDHAELARSPLGEGLPEGRYVVLEISDQGMGMSVETQARIFDPFFTTRSDGRGFGLSVVMGVVKGHFGALTVQSASGVGTTFRVLLPADGAP